jgi:hypothetical protein
MAMCDPVLTEHLHGTRRQADVAVFGSFTAMCIDQYPRAGDVTDLKVQPFAEPRSQGVNSPEMDPVVVGADGRDEPSHLLDRKDIGELFVSADAELLEQRLTAGRECESRKA